MSFKHKKGHYVIKGGVPSWVKSLIFLDFDGVLHTNDYNCDQFAFLGDFESAILGYENVGIVLSTSWRVERDFAALQRIFGPVTMARVIGATPVSANSFADGGREEEVREFMRCCQIEHMPWVALDDMGRLFKTKENLIEVDPQFGLGFIELEILKRRLKAWDELLR